MRSRSLNRHLLTYMRMTLQRRLQWQYQMHPLQQLQLSQSKGGHLLHGLLHRGSRVPYLALRQHHNLHQRLQLNVHRHHQQSVPQLRPDVLRVCVSLMRLLVAPLAQPTQSRTGVQLTSRQPTSGSAGLVLALHMRTRTMTSSLQVQLQLGLPRVNYRRTCTR